LKIGQRPGRSQPGFTDQPAVTIARFQHINDKTTSGLNAENKGPIYTKLPDVISRLWVWNSFIMNQ